MCAATAMNSSAQTLTTIYDFCSQYPCPDGADPLGALVQGHDGNFYGTLSDVGFVGQGTVYKLTSSGAFTVLHSFTGLSDGGVPEAGLIQASDGNFYGDTRYGGASGCGNVYKITASGTLTNLHAFAGGAHDGCQPSAATGAGERWQLLRDDLFSGGSPPMLGNGLQNDGRRDRNHPAQLLHAIRLP